MKLINTSNKDFIEIHDNLVISSDDFLVIEIPNFYWGTHSNGCKTCKTFIESFKNGLTEWIIEFENKYYTFEQNDFGEIDYFKNNFSSYIGKQKVQGSKCKLKIKEEIQFKEEYLKEYESLEMYEICSFIKENLKYDN